MRLITMLFFFMLLNSCFAQISVDSAASILSGGTSKEWIASPWKNVMGASSDKKCSGGETYTFYKDNTVKVRKCVNGSVQQKKVNWKIIKESDDNILLIDTIKYQLRPKVGSTSEVQLRTVVTDKRLPSSVVILKYEKY